MSRKATKLTDVRIRNAKQCDFPLWVGGGLHLILSAAGSRLWRLKYYRPDGRENRIGLGEYPGITLAMATRLRDAVRLDLAKGIDPSEQRQESKDAKRREVDATFDKAAAR